MKSPPPSLLLLAAALAVLFVVAAPLSRCAPPARVEERAARVFDERAQLDATTATTTARARHVETRTERRPDGTVTRVRVEDEHEGTSVSSATRATEAAHASETTVRVVGRARPSWRATVAAGWRPSDAARVLVAAPPVLRVEVSRRVLGPASLGVWCSRDRGDYSAGLALGWEW